MWTGKTGVLFKTQTVEDVQNAIEKLETMKFDKELIREHALKFREEEFRKQIIEFVNKKYDNFNKM